MPFDIECQAVLAAITVKSKVNDGITVRICRMKLKRDFDELIAAAIGGDARRALAGLNGGGMSKVEMPIDAVTVTTTLESDTGEKAKIEAAAGIRAIGIAPIEKTPEGATARDENIAKVTLEFDFYFNEDVWNFLGRNCGASARISFKPMQLDFEQRLAGLGKRKLDTSAPPLPPVAAPANLS